MLVKVLDTGEEGRQGALVKKGVENKGMCEHSEISGGYRANGGFGSVGYGVTISKSGFVELMLVLEVKMTTFCKSLSRF